MAVDETGVLVGKLQQGAVGVGDVGEEPGAEIEIVLVATVGDFLGDEALVLADADEEHAGDKDVNRLQAELVFIVLGHQSDFVLPVGEIFDQRPGGPQFHDLAGVPAGVVGKSAVESASSRLEIAMIGSFQMSGESRLVPDFGHEPWLIHAGPALGELVQIGFQCHRIGFGL